MTEVTVRDALRGVASVGSEVTLKAWVRTRRDSKHGFSFINLHDGSCFDPIQVVADQALENYAEEILHLTAGCAVIATGELVESKGKGQQVEIHAASVDVIGWVENPDTYPVAAQASHLRASARSGASAPTHQYDRRHRPRSPQHGAGHPSLFPRTRFRLGEHPHYHRQRLRRRRGVVSRQSTLDLANIPREDNGKLNFSEDFFGTEAYLTVSGQLSVECVLPARCRNVYTFGPTFRAENSNTIRHLAEFWMIEPEIAFADLDDDVTISLRSFLKYIFGARIFSRSAPTTWRSSPNVRRQRSRGRTPRDSSWSTRASSAWSTARPSAILEKAEEEVSSSP